MPVERREGVTGRSGRIREILARALEGGRLEEGDIVRLFEADGPDIALVAGAADELRRQVVGDAVTYVVNRNINYTNICLYKCGFCAFSKGTAKDLRGPAYMLDLEAVGRRAAEIVRASCRERGCQ